MAARLVCIVFLIVFAWGLQAGTFTDTFSLPNGSLPSLWANESGSWSVHNGTYDAGAGTPSPNAHSLLPWTLTNFTVDLDTTTVGDGGVWLRATDAPGTSVGVAGILFVFRGGDMYFHDVTDGSGYGGMLGSVGHSSGAHHITITVSGNVYSVSIDGGAGTTSYTSSTFTSGRVGLYDYIPLGFDNFNLRGDGVSQIPEPGTAVGLLLGSGALLLAKRQRRA